ncbi:hypothetical protein NS376_16025 [Pseudomonas oryzihabitans]|nr:hypothetical protein NS376_16025 [Pseudomonas psychrotolerans]
MAAKQPPKTSAKAKTPQLCKVRYEYTDWVLPMDKGLALVALLTDAEQVRYHNEGASGSRYKAEAERGEISLEILKPGQFLPAGPTQH